MFVWFLYVLILHYKNNDLTTILNKLLILIPETEFQ